MVQETEFIALSTHFSSRSKDVIEPIVKAQWYVKCAEMGKKALDAVNTGELKLIPEFHTNTWRRWLEEIR